MDTKIQKQEKILQLKELASSAGWKLVKQELQDALSITEAKLFGDIKAEDFETQEHLRRERADRIILINFPEDMIEELTSEIESSDEANTEGNIDTKSFDPYE